MIPSEFANFFIGCAGVGGALIGLLFVAISIAPDRTVMRTAPVEWRATATSALGAIADPFFISLVALLPGINAGWGVLCFAALGLANTLLHARLLFAAPRDRNQSGVTRRIALIAPGAMIFTGQLVLAGWLLAAPQAEVLVYLLAISLVVSYLVGMIRAWELLAPSSMGLLTLMDRGHELASPPSRPAPDSTPPAATRAE